MLKPIAYLENVHRVSARTFNSLNQVHFTIFHKTMLKPIAYLENVYRVSECLSPRNPSFLFSAGDQGYSISDGETNLMLIHHLTTKQLHISLVRVNLHSSFVALHASGTNVR